MITKSWFQIVIIASLWTNPKSLCRSVGRSWVKLFGLLGDAVSITHSHTCLCLRCWLYREYRRNLQSSQRGFIRWFVKSVLFDNSVGQFDETRINGNELSSRYDPLAFCEQARQSKSSQSMVVGCLIWIIVINKKSDYQFDFFLYMPKSFLLFLWVMENISDPMKPLNKIFFIDRYTAMDLKKQYLNLKTTGTHFPPTAQTPGPNWIIFL